jgi:glycerol-3-phosphate O-acyltransferase
LNVNQPLHNEPQWPAEAGQRVVFLVDASSTLEGRLVQAWIDRVRPVGSEAVDVDVLEIPASRRRGRGAGIDPRLEQCVAAGEDVLLAPMRVAWLAPERDGVRSVSWSDLLTFGDPRDPGRWRQHRTLRHYRDRCRVVAGAPALLSELRERWSEATHDDTSATLGLAEFIVRQANLALERAERQLRGARYKVPRFVRDDILSQPAVRGALSRQARESDRSEASVAKDASRYLKEIAATHSPYVIDLAASLIRALWSQGYRSLRFDDRQLAGIAALGQRHPVVFLPSHKSNLDHLVLQYALHVCGLPPNHTAGGINMNFFPVGPLMRRSGVFFIRRSFRDNPLYKFVLRRYIDYLIGKRFSLEWYVEGGRSRSGKLLPPRFGLLGYVVDSWRRGRAEDVFLIPVSIAYDQISDVGDYAAEQRGAKKEKESFGWFVGIVRRMRNRYGDIHIRFGDPISLAESLDAPDPDAEVDPDSPVIEIQKLAFETCVRINRVTPITPTSLVALALLGTGNRALTVDEILLGMRNLLDYTRRRKLPTTHELDDLESPDGVRRALGALQQSGVVSCFDEGPEAVYAIERDQHHAAAYYRNTVAHFFMNGAIVELALLAAARENQSDPAAAFWEEAMRLRDLLKFDFFFAEKEEFRRELREELAYQHPDWEQRLAATSAEILGMVRDIRPFAAHRVLRPFLDGYDVVADALARRSPAAEFEQGPFVDDCLRLGRQYLLQGRVKSPGSISKPLFETAVRLAANRGLVEPGGQGLSGRRKEFAAEVRDALRRVEIIEALAAARRAGLPG